MSMVFDDAAQIIMVGNWMCGGLQEGDAFWFSPLMYYKNLIFEAYVMYIMR